jgi:hypothetical protein
LDPGNTQNWSSVDSYYDPQGHLAVQDTAFDSGYSSHTIYDVNNNQPWSWVSDTTIPDGPGTNPGGIRVGTNDNGTTFRTDWTLGTANVITSRTQTYSASGALLYTDTYSSNASGALVHKNEVTGQVSALTNANGILQASGAMQDINSFPSFLAIPNIAVPQNGTPTLYDATPLFEWSFDGAIVLPPIVIVATPWMTTPW